MNPYDQPDARLREALACVAQMHRRELRARSQAQAAEAELAAIRATDGFNHESAPPTGSPGTLLQSMGSALRRVFRRAPSDKPATALPAPKPARLAAASFHGSTRISIPLTLDRQLIRVPRCSNARELWGTAIGADATTRCALEVIHAAAEGAEPGAEDPVHDSIQLSSGRPHLLWPVEAGTEDLVLEVARTEGTFCILLLELCDADSAGRNAAVAHTPNEHSSPATRQNHSPTTALANTTHCAKELEQKLWGGYAFYAAPELEHLLHDPRAPLKERAAAAWYLTRWHYVAEDYVCALTIIEFAKSLSTNFATRFALAEAQCLIRIGRDDEAVALLQGQHNRARTSDCLLLLSTAIRNSSLSKGQSLNDAETRQLAVLNSVFERAGLTTLSKKRADEPLSLANIACHASARSTDQNERVSVIVPAYNAEDTIAWVIDSLLAQTWRNLEIIVVDDGSSDRTADIVSEIAECDSRLRLVRLDRNGGSYPARNAGARAATGDLIMVHDSDDWSHPQQIEMHVDALHSYPLAAGVRSHWARVGERLEVAGTWIPRGSMFEVNISSFLFRRSVFDELGFWDDVLVSGDGEFLSRFRTVYGEESLVTLPRTYLLALSLTREKSLTRSSATHLKSLFYGMRWNYLDAYRWWHQRLTHERELPFAATPNERPFPVPIGNQPGKASSHAYDLIVIADFAAPGASCEAAISYCVAAARAAKRVAVFHWRHYDLTIRVPLRSEFYETCHRYRIDILSVGDRVTTDIALVAAPSVLEHKIDPRPEIDARHVVVSYDRGARPGAGVAPFETFDLLNARAHLQEIFGSEGIWVPMSREAEQAMRADGRFPEPTVEAWLPVVDTAALAREPLRWRGADRSAPVIGRRLVGEFDWPSRLEDLELAYGADRPVTTRFHGDTERFADMLPALPRNWQLLTRNGISGVDFCRDLDFYVHYPHELSGGRISQGLLEAMALGIPVIAPPRYAEIFGDAVVYASPQHALRTVSDLWSSESEYLSRAAAARAFVLKHFGMEGFPARLDGITSGAQPLDVRPAVKSECA